MTSPYELGTVDAAVGVLRDLYVDLRRKVRFWSGLTFQTPQARMGYVGQHLVSAVSGFPGARSGARGHDLILPDGRHGEIKTCSRVDQLGSCNTCAAVVSSVENECPSCAGTDILRKDDSKWLIGARSHAELLELFDPEFFYLVLFDFVSITGQADINARIWRVNPRTKGFAYCMIDYFHNIGSRSASGAPFNLWPFKLKFDLLAADLIFHARITAEDEIEVLVFDEVLGAAQPDEFPTLLKYARSGGTELEPDALIEVASALGVQTVATTKRELLADIELARASSGIADRQLIDVVCDALYGRRIRAHLEDLPPGVAAPSLAFPSPSSASASPITRLDAES